MIKIGLLAILTFLIFETDTFCQSTENQGWLFLSHTQKFSKKWDGLADIQLRSADKLIRFETVLLRGGLSYNIGDEHAVAVGYTYKGDWEEGENKLNYQTEHRIYQQYLYNHDIKRTEVNVRFRLEQRFVKELEGFNFSQRLRGFLSFQIPLSVNQDFSKGVYTGIQNELFVNVQHKENVNNSFFDQNRAYISVGYRWSERVDTEIGYMNWRQKEMNEKTKTDVLQLMITTKL